jgi:molybdate transport system substrate-binding protein
MRWLWPVLLVALTVAACGKRDAAGGATLTIAAASSMKPAMEDLIAAYRDEPGAKGISITATYGASGNFCAQIQNGAPFDLFYSADTTYPAELVKSGQGLEGTQRVYARGALVLWAPREGGPDVAARGAEILKDPSVQHIAIANPKVAPYGRAAEAALNSLGLNDAAAAKLVLGENVEQTAQFAQTGAAQAAFLPLSLVTTPAMSSSGSYWTVPTDKYPAIEHGVVVTGRGERADRARAFDAFVAGPRGREILSRHGFGGPRE